MTIRNISEKLINIGLHRLMPDEAISGLAKAEASTPGVLALVEQGFLKVEDDAPTNDDMAKAEAKPSTRTKKSAASE